MSIVIVRTYLRVREPMASNKDIESRLAGLECGHDRTTSVIEVRVEDIGRVAREVKDMKALPRISKRRVGGILDDEGDWKSQSAIASIAWLPLTIGKRC
jgi:hypothetical protein